MNGNEIPIDTLDGTFGEDTSQFTKSNKKAPNLATYYFKHEDTDSEMDKNNLKIEAQSTLEETSEEEWVYTKTNETTLVAMEIEEEIETRSIQSEESIEFINAKPKFIPEDTIRRLVQKAEELVSPEKCRKNSLKKLSRVNKWLSVEKPDDSCDASGEDDEKESQTSEEIDASTMTLREANSDHTSNSELNGNRLSWCGSCNISQLNQSTSTPAINFSISESSIHKMALNQRILDRFTLSNSNFNGHQSTSSTVEEVSPMIAEKTSPMRRKKYKIKKKAQIFGKSDTHLLYSPNQHKHRNLLIKSGSFSGYSSTVITNERYTSSDPSAVNICPRNWCETSTTSGADSDDDITKRLPNFKPGLRTRYLQGSDLRDISPGKSSLNTAEEQSSSLSEQAWDNYQENYLSEQYSESHDSDAVKSLLNFGEDYRNYIDSQSDWSAFSDMSPKFKRKSFTHQNVRENHGDDSNSDEESLKKLISDSRDQLKYAEEIYEQVKDGINNMIGTTEIEELVMNCDRHIALLNRISESSDEYKMSTGDKAVATGLLSQWRGLKIKSLKMQDYRKLQKEIVEMKNFITSLSVPDKKSIHFPNYYPSEDLNNELETCKKILETLKNQSTKLTTLNSMVHRFTLENQDFDDFAKCTLRSDISDLYEMFDNAKLCACTKINQIENMLPAWKTLETRLEQLHKDLQEDEKTIHLLDSVLTSGQFTDQTASSVRDVAKLLSETNTYQGYPLNELFTCESSFSDSGISDEGSEHEPGERQGRLAAIRRLVRQLEAGLAPESGARLRMRDKLRAAEEELRSLQLQCRELIVRTATASATTPEKILSGVAAVAKEAQEKLSKSKSSKDDGDDPGDNPQPANSGFKRMFKASLAFQLVILTFVCLRYFFEPQCCDYMNNYSWSFSPKLHYEGKPPI